MSGRRDQRYDSAATLSKMGQPHIAEGMVSYPATAHGGDFDDFHGTRVADPFRWLEQSGSAAVLTWTEGQNATTTDYLQRTSDIHGIRARLQALWAIPRSSLPHRFDETTFEVRLEPLHEQPTLWRVDAGPPITTTELLDPNAIAADGSAALTGWAADPTGRLLAYAISWGGSDRQEMRIRDVRSGVDYPEVLQGMKSEEDLPFPNMAWRPDATGFYYNRLPAPDTGAAIDAYRGSQVYLHRIGTPQNDDILVFERPADPELNFVPIVTGDGRYLLMHAWRGLSGRHQVFFRPIEGDGDFMPLFRHDDARYLFLGTNEDRLFFHTNAGAPHGRVIALKLTGGRVDSSVEVLPEQREPIVRAYLFAHRIVLVTVRDSHHRLSVFETDGSPGPALELPGLGTISDVACDAQSNRLLVAFESFLRPLGTLGFDLGSGSLVHDSTPAIPFDPSPYATEQHFVPTSDGTQIPVTVVHRTDVSRDGRSPLLLYGYGGFNVNTTPLFDPLVVSWLERGGVYAFANPRGGGEYGDSWHEAGRRQQKQICFDDFIRAAEWLIEEGYTSSSRLAIRGESNGGLLVAACMLQRPALFGAVVCNIPVTDMLRFGRYTIGHYWTYEYGDAAADVQDFRMLSRYSPLQNVRAEADYPPILVTTGDGDDRVVPSHAMKFVATLQSASDSTSRPRLLRVQHNVGHGLGKPTSKMIDLDTDILAFLLATIGTELPSAKASPGDVVD